MKLICRTCLRMQNKYFNIFTHLENNKLISDILMEHTTIKVHKNDGLPINMCAACLKKLNLARDFQEMVIKSDVQLHDFYRKVLNNKKLHNSTICLSKTIEDELPSEDKRYGSSICSLDESKLINLQNKSEQQEKLTVLNINYDNSFEQMLPQNDKNEVTELLSDHDSKCDLGPYTVIDYPKNEFIENNDDLISKEGDISPTDNYNGIQFNSIINEVKENETSQNNFDNGFSHSNNLQIKNNVINGKAKESVILKNEEINFMDFKNKDKQRYFCKDCNRSFGYRYYFGIHVRQHTGDKPHKCEFCDKSFAKPFLLKIHKHVHSTEKPHSCHICGKTFRYSSSLPNHMLTHSEIRAYKCNVCGKAFKVENTLRTHLLIHKSEKSIVCEICGKSFNNKCGLIHHMRCHKTEKTFACSTCGKCFSNNSYLKTHYRRRHTNEKSYVCNYCDKRFKCNETLKNHIRVHTGVKPYSCKICGKAFTQASCITRHMRIHTGETPYECKQCPRSFKYSHHLVNHMKMHK